MRANLFSNNMSRVRRLLLLEKGERIIKQYERRGREGESSMRREGGRVIRMRKTVEREMQTRETDLTID